MTLESVMEAYWATGRFTAAVCCLLAESAEDCTDNLRPHFVAIFDVHAGKDYADVSREELKDLMLRSARKAVELLEGMK
jgi:hypothetical protein